MALYSVQFTHFSNRCSYHGVHTTMNNKQKSKDFNLGEAVEYGLMRRLQNDFDGDNDPYVFTWSDDIPSKTWAIASGCATFYNAGRKTANCKMIRDFDNDSFTFIATKNIKKDDELFHEYTSLDCRTCFQELAKLTD
eukprot:1137032_1